MEGVFFYIKTETFILIPVLYVIGIILDQSPFIPKWAHAWIKMAFAIISCLLYFGVDIRSVMQGILVTGVEMIFRDTTHNAVFGIYERTKSKNSKMKVDEDEASKE